VGAFSLADLVHQFLDIARSHRNANEHSELQCGTQEQPGGRQIQVEDPDGNPIELFEPAR
jgi:hypothetical protein